MYTFNVYIIEGEDLIFYKKDPEVSMYTPKLADEMFGFGDKWKREVGTVHAKTVHREHRSGPGNRSLSHGFRVSPVRYVG